MGLKILDHFFLIIFFLSEFAENKKETNKQKKPYNFWLNNFKF